MDFWYNHLFFLNHYFVCIIDVELHITYKIIIGSKVKKKLYNNKIKLLHNKNSCKHLYHTTIHTIDTQSQTYYTELTKKRKKKKSDAKWCTPCKNDAHSKIFDEQSGELYWNLERWQVNSLKLMHNKFDSQIWRTRWIGELIKNR